MESTNEESPLIQFLKTELGKEDRKLPSQEVINALISLFTSMNKYRPLTRDFILWNEEGIRKYNEEKLTTYKEVKKELGDKLRTTLMCNYHHSRTEEPKK